MGKTISLPLLDQIRIASPCPAKWSEMSGDDRVRHCAQCDLDVHNISAMTRDEAEGVLQKLAEGRVCARFYRRADGTILTRDCPTGIAIARKKLLRGMSHIAAAIGLAVLAGTMASAAEDTSWGQWGWAIRLRHSPPVVWASSTITRVRFRLFPSSCNNAWMGAVGGPSLPPGPPPQVAGIKPPAKGPHLWEELLR